MKNHSLDFRCIVALAAVVFFLAMPIRSSAAADGVSKAPEAEAVAGLLKPRSLTREPDPVVIQGKEIPNARGLAIDGFRVYAHRDGVTVPIPFDFNERDEDGDYVLTQGQKPTKGTGLVADASELAYMAHDTGDRVSASSLPGGWTKAFEIETADPLNDRKGWAYLLHFGKDAPPRSSDDYVSITEVDEPDPFTGKPYVVIQGKYFYGRNIKNSPIFYHLRGTKEGGYEEKSFSDHFSTRSRMKIMGFVPFSVDETSIWSETPAYYDGSVRFIRRINLKILVGKVKIPTGIVIDITGYDLLANVPIKIKIPSVVKAISRDAWASYGLDLNSEAAGEYTFYSNTHPEGIPITGKNDPEGKSFGFDKKELVSSKDYWSIITGPYGTFMRRHTTPAEIEEGGVRQYSTFVDDLDEEYAPEYEKGQVGNHLTWLEVQNAPYGLINMNSYVYYPPHFKYPDDVQTYLNVLDNPITSSVTEVGRSGMR
ncbi:MAG: hypothetical protein Q8R92_10260 [Deltaproteobacteria bacterium]|nr:hypothetical protein [Deltaproteobacteria bacterium]